MNNSSTKHFYILFAFYIERNWINPVTRIFKLSGPSSPALRTCRDHRPARISPAFPALPGNVLFWGADDCTVGQGKQEQLRSPNE